MKAVYLKNFRKGFATNSSSTHSLIYKNKGDMFEDLNIFELNYYDRFDNTIAATKDAKIKYIAADVFYNKKLFDLLCAIYPEMKEYEGLATQQRNSEKYGETFGMYTRGSLYFDSSENLEASLDYIKNIIENDEIIIVGGSDEEDFVYETTENHVKLPKPDDVDIYDNRPQGVVKNGNYWVGYGFHGKLRFSTTKGECIPEYPELIDLRITNKCEHGCNFCFMDSNMKEKHADLQRLKTIIHNLSTSYRAYYKKRIEFSIGGGNILLYPELEELFKYLTENGHIVNTTNNAKDCEKIVNDKKFKRIFSDYVTAIGVSVSDEKDIDKVLRLKNAFENSKNYKQITIHLIPELLGVEKTRDIMTKLKSFYSFLFLGYKTNGRGASQKYTKFTDEELTRLFEDMYCIRLDTTFANTYYNWFKDNYEVEYTITLNEGEYSMYIDGVEGIAYKSSYQLDKPYSLVYTDYKEHGVKWFNPIEAFANIRKDNGFPVYDRNNS